MRSFGNTIDRRAVALAGLVVVVDLGAKALVERHLEEPIDLIAGVELRLGHNSGVAFGVFNGLPRVVLAVVVITILGGLLAAVSRRWLPLSWPGLGLLLGGAVANLLDRTANGRVTDFIDPPWWPPFNLADVAITLAAVSLLAPRRESTRTLPKGSTRS